MKRKDLFLTIIVIMVLVIGVFIQKNSGLFQAGGGFNLKDLNKKDTTSCSASVTLQGSQTNEQTLFQGLVFADYYNRMNGFFIGSSIVGTVSTEFGVVAPVLYFSSGLEFNNYQLEYRIGSFKRSSIGVMDLDPQYTNFCIVAGEGGGVSNSMQLSIVRGDSRIGFGHTAVNNFYQFGGGTWYGYVETPICNWLKVGGGLNFAQAVTGYVAAQVKSGNNGFTITGNNLGSESQSVVAAYNRNNIPLGKKLFNIGVSGWAKSQEHGGHFVVGIPLGKFNIFAQAGGRIVSNLFTPYFGTGINLTL